MKIYYDPTDFVKLKTAVVTSGTFDGVHLGHQKILHRLKEIALNVNGETVVITFWPHPRLVLSGTNTTLKLLNTFEEKAALLREQGIQHLLRVPFTKEFSQLSSSEFIARVLVETIGTKKLVIGYDHRFGKNREGSFDELKRNGPTLGFDVEEIPRQDIDHVAVNSSTIRKALEEGDVETAAHFLGRPYAVSGVVVSGDKIGRQLGYPTANIEVDSHFKLIPAQGIYAVWVYHSGQRYGGMLYIGDRPTLGGSRLSVEVNIFDFAKDIYGETIQVTFEKFLRADQKFDGLDALTRQLALDQEAAMLALGLKNESTSTV
jgi:riboflavin kinase/FMN adenylyltransferase